MEWSHCGAGYVFLSRCELHVAVVAGHLQIADAAEWLRVALTSENNGAFPIVGHKFCFAGQFLGCERRFRIQLDGKFRNRYLPVNGIHGASLRVRPFISSRLQAEMT